MGFRGSLRASMSPPGDIWTPPSNVDKPGPTCIDRLDDFFLRIELNQTPPRERLSWGGLCPFPKAPELPAMECGRELG